MACSDDDTPVTAGDDAGTTEPDCEADCGDVEVTIPDRAPDLVRHHHERRAVRPDHRGLHPAEDLDPDGAVSSEDPPVCTPEDNDVLGTILVEENPDDPPGAARSATRSRPRQRIAGDGR